MGIFLLWNALLTSKSLAGSICIVATAMLILNGSACATKLYDWSKPIPLIWELPFSQWCAKTFHASEQSDSLILGAISEQRTFVPSEIYLIGMGSERRMIFFILSYCTNKASFHNYIWWHFKFLPMLFGVECFFGGITSRCETTGLTWSNMELISSRSVLW